MATQTFSGLLIGMALHVLAVAIIEITFNLYVMDHIPREDLSHFEPLRMLVMALPWAVAPWLGVFLRGNLSPLAPFLLAALCALILFGYFWYLRLSDDPTVSPAKGPPPSAFKNIRRFVSQPRLLLAWSLAAGRSSWWVLFFVYGPLFAVESGLSEETAGLIASIGAGSLFAVPLWAWVGRRISLRKLMMLGYGASAFFSILVLSGVGIPFAIAVLLVLSAYATGIIDAAGNLPFLRGVHHWERPEMTSVFATYRDFSQLAPPGIFSLVLRIFPLQSLFVICGCSMLVLAFFCRYLPRRL